jgi:hypothetical protein
MTGLSAFCGSVGLLVGITYVILTRIDKLQKQIDVLKRELEEMKRK